MNDKIRIRIKEIEDSAIGSMADELQATQIADESKGVCTTPKDVYRGTESALISPALLCRCQQMAQDDCRRLHMVLAQGTSHMTKRNQEMQKQRIYPTDMMYRLHSIPASEEQRRCCIKGMAKLKQMERQRSFTCT